MSGTAVPAPIYGSSTSTSQYLIPEAWSSLTYLSNNSTGSPLAELKAVTRGSLSATNPAVSSSLILTTSETEYYLTLS